MEADYTGETRLGSRRSGPAVAIFEPHDVVELYGRDLDQGRVVHAREPVPGQRRDVMRLAGLHDPLDHRRALPFCEGLAGLADLQPQLARLNVDRLVLLLVVLQRQGLARADEEHLARVTVGPGPEQLVPPRLGRLVDHSVSSRARAPASAGGSGGNAARTRSSISSAVDRESTS